MGWGLADSSIHQYSSPQEKISGIHGSAGICSDTTCGYCPNGKLSVVNTAHCIDIGYFEGERCVSCQDSE